MTPASLPSLDGPAEAIVLITKFLDCECVLVSLPPPQTHSQVSVTCGWLLQLPGAEVLRKSSASSAALASWQHS